MISLTLKKLDRLKKQLEDLRRRVGNIRPREMEKFAKACGRIQHKKRRGEPTWVSKYFPKLLRPLSIPHHSVELNRFTAENILDQLEMDLDAIEESLQARKRGG